MIASLLLVAGVGIGYGVRSGSAAILVIGVWVFLMACTLAFMAGIARLGKAAERVAQQKCRPAHEVAMQKIKLGVMETHPSGQGDRLYPAEEDCPEDED